MNMGKYRLVRSRTNRFITGVCGGIGETFGIDPTIVRVIWAAVTLLSSGLGIVLYVIASIIIPLDDVEE